MPHRPDRPPVAGISPAPADSRTIYAQAMTRILRMTAALSAVLLASVARALIDGLDLARRMVVAITAGLLRASLVLWRHGSRLKRTGLWR